MQVSAGFHIERPATFILSRMGESGIHTAVFAGMADNLADTLVRHRRIGVLDEAWSLGGEWLHIHLVSWTAEQRRHVTEDIVRWHRPALNLRLMASDYGAGLRRQAD
jgi:hypothetical protein